MPIYEYTCNKCADNFEHLARNLADHPQKCPSCGSRRVSKQFSAFATTKTFQMASGQASCPKAPSCPAASSCASGGCGGGA